MRKEKQSRDGIRVYSRMREAILRLEFRPGTPIDEARVADELEVSRTPVREAIIQLIADGLVIRNGRIARVAPLDFDDVPKLLNALLTASRLINRLAAEHRTSEDLSAIETAMIDFEKRHLSANGLVRSELNMAFHMNIAHAADNSYIQNFYETTLRAQIRLARACFSGAELGHHGTTHDEENLVSHMTETARQHRLIYEAIRDGDVEGVDRMTVEHEMLARERLQKKLFLLDAALQNFDLQAG